MSPAQQATLALDSVLLRGLGCLLQGLVQEPVAWALAVAIMGSTRGREQALAPVMEVTPASAQALASALTPAALEVLIPATAVAVALALGATMGTTTGKGSAQARLATSEVALEATLEVRAKVLHHQRDIQMLTGHKFKTV